MDKEAAQDLERIKQLRKGCKGEHLKEAYAKLAYAIIVMYHKTFTENSLDI